MPKFRFTLGVVEAVVVNVYAESLLEAERLALSGEGEIIDSFIEGQKVLSYEEIDKE